MATIGQTERETMPTAYEELMVRRALNRERLSEPDVDREWESLSRSLFGNDSSAERRQKNTIAMGNMARRIGLTIVGIAAAIALVVVFYPTVKSALNPRIELISAVSQVPDITVTASDGEQTLVEPGEPLSFVREPSAENVMAKARDLVVYTPRGTTCEVTLPDGTLAWLNGQSRISFPEQFTDDSRLVEASGEVYFEVVKDESRPFTVSTKYFSTTVKGTSFNLRAHSEKDASVALISGRVEVSAPNGGKAVMEPGEMASLDGGRMDVRPVDTYPLTQWKDGFFYFDDNTLSEIMMELGRWYNVNVVFEKPKMLDIRLHFVADHYESVDEITGRINELASSAIEFDGETITVK